jgi:hypothetical protein
MSLDSFDGVAGDDCERWEPEVDPFGVDADVDLEVEVEIEEEEDEEESLGPLRSISFLTQSFVNPLILDAFSGVRLSYASVR